MRSMQVSKRETKSKILLSNVKNTLINRAKKQTVFAFSRSYFYIKILQTMALFIRVALR